MSDNSAVLVYVTFLKVFHDGVVVYRFILNVHYRVMKIGIELLALCLYFLDAELFKRVGKCFKA